jgi:hypothetical protein
MNRFKGPPSSKMMLFYGGKSNNEPVYAIDVANVFIYS